MFSQREYKRRLQEGATEIVPPLRVFASDADINTESNGNVHYTVVADSTGGLVKIDPYTGEVCLHVLLNTLGFRSFML